MQLIALFYKDQHVENMQKLLATWLDMTSSDSSEDDESNTSPPVSQLSSHSTCPVLFLSFFSFQS